MGWVQGSAPIWNKSLGWPTEKDTPSIKKKEGVVVRNSQKKCVVTYSLVLSSQSRRIDLLTSSTRLAERREPSPCLFNDDKGGNSHSMSGNDLVFGFSIAALIALIAWLSLLERNIEGEQYNLLLVNGCRMVHDSMRLHFCLILQNK
jgi:hypothetical protein